MEPLADNAEIGYPGKRGYFNRQLMRRSPDKVTFPPEPIYEDNVENSTAQSERNRKTQNVQLKNACLDRC